ncbi:hypothetical protein [Rhizobium lentis]|uniref:Uncharacterized protein n=1 Tax=Rhizobium lentis TaxID=1138194 RepID=A0A9Q3ME04_9HYPH|nr:hypothetical protein [Rhizobium lentis]MBX4959081.1 hypothetical protein [Rhizobium lentis]MBX4972658.1 hypothetical protein [Rhizobium lentis]MBX4989087.1 hypothetical protein [Rhizobium lentis]MBX4998588.1 hypothetical protein [Rhizobium lentis]MBX5007536.1 hypothetical protein [Rhizobium lentis]
MKIAGVFRLCLAAALAAPTAVNANQCDPSKPVYVFDQFDQGDDKIFYKIRDGEHPFFEQLIRFETWRKSKLVWSVDGSVICSDVVAMCELTLASSNKSDPGSAIYDCFEELKKEQEQDTPTTKISFKIPVTEISTKHETSHIAFGFLTALSLVCSKHMDIHVERKALLVENERKGMFLLPPFVRRVPCLK